jgi:hypothetical protein
MRSARTYHLRLLAIFLGLAGKTLLAQSPFDPEFSMEASRIREEVRLFTDRNLYAVNEDIQFMAEHRVTGALGNSFWSSVLYMELLAPSGIPVAQGKYLLLGGRARGTIQIPASALTGDYTLKCYSRWMRNQGPASFAYMPLKIINPFRSEVAAQEGEASPAVSLSRVSYKRGLDCVASSPVYLPGDEVKLQLSGTLPAHLEQLPCCLTVVPAGAVDLDRGQFLISRSQKEQEDFRVSYLPDLGNGVAVSGTVVDAAQEPATFATLHFSLLGDHPDYFATISDEHGRFIFSTPAGEGQMELFVTPQTADGTLLEVRIDQEYDSRPVSLPREKFGLSDLERDLARRTALNVQLAEAFSTGFSAADSISSAGPASPSLSHKPFYGTRVKKLLIDDYVRLPNLEEVFINLVPDVQFYNKGGETRIRILSDNASIAIFEPLIMIDHISVFDHEAVLALPPEKIERIDLINEIYLKGNAVFGGVVAIYSKEGDLAGIDLPEGSYFFDYQSLYPRNASRQIQLDRLKKAASGRIPDTRNTIYWTSDLQLRKGNALEISFRAPEMPGEYVILVRGVDRQGEVLTATARFRVD